MDREPNDLTPLAASPGRRFRGPDVERKGREAINPYIEIHREFVDEIIPADAAAGLGDRAADLFGRDAPLHLEIGSGNGFYLSGMAALHPEADWIGLEIRFKRVVLAARKLQVVGVKNARLVRYDAFLLEDLFGPGRLAGIHVNHPDPWARRRQEGRRLVGPAFVAVAAKMLAVGGELRLKTDFEPHVDALLEAMEGLPLRVRGTSRDVLRDGAPWPDEVRTNYQRKAEERGVPVYAVWAEKT